jgi:uncharacterized coiled-coil protein SlyX
MSVRSRRLDDRIRELCARVASSKDAEEVNLILPELQSAIHQAIHRLRLRAVAVMSGRAGLRTERRKPP